MAKTDTIFFFPGCQNVPTVQILPEEESQHAVKVLRLQVGEEIAVVDGVGGFYTARITNPHPKHCGFEITEVKSGFGKHGYKLHIAIAPTKNIERLEWFLEKATEIIRKLREFSRIVYGTHETGCQGQNWTVS